jgi:DNA-binding beta-propeller fold protein YncE
VTTTSGTGNGLAVFTFDANAGATRTGTLTIAGQTLTVTQAGSSYVLANPLTNLVSTGLNDPIGVAVDGAGNVYFADTVNNALKEYNASTQQVSTLVSTGLLSPEGVALDGAGNVYVADNANGAIKEYIASSQQVSTLVSGLGGTAGVAVDGVGNVYFTDNANSAIKEYNAATQQVSALVSSGLNYPNGVAVDGAGNVYIADTLNNAIKELPRDFVSTTALSEGPSAGTDAPLPVLPTSERLTPPFVPTSDQSWLTIGTPGNGIIPFSFTANPSLTPRTAHITVLGQSIPVTQSGPSLGTTAVVEGPAAGSDSDIVVAGAASWTASSNDPSWLHVTTTSGTGNGLAVFTFDANSGATRTGTLTIAGQTLTVTQAGSSYVLANPVTSLVSSGLYGPGGVAVDGAGNVYFSDSVPAAIQEYNATTQQVSTLVSSGLNAPAGVAVDGAGNVYFADTGNNAIYEYNATTKQVSTLVSTGLNQPVGVAVDGAGNVYIADASNNAIEEYNASTQQVSTLVSTGLTQPQGVAVDGAGNVYIADFGNSAIKEYNPSTQQVSTLVSTGLSFPGGVAVDGAGNVYIADTGNHAIKEYNASTQQVSTLVSSGLTVPLGVAVDGTGNVYIADANQNNSAIKELPRAFVSTAPINVGPNAGTAAPLPVLPTSERLTPPFVPTSDQSWLTIGTISNGVINFSFTANPNLTARTAHITVLGQSITVTQSGPSLGTTSVVEGPAAGTDSDIVVAGAASWTASSNAPSWLHVTTTSGTGNGLAVFTFDANTGGTRTDTLTIAGLTLTVTQAGSSYVLANPLTDLASSGLAGPIGVAVDGAGNVYFADPGNNTVEEYIAATQQVIPLVSSGLNTPIGVAVDDAGNVYIADQNNNAIKEYIASSQQVVPLVSSGLSGPRGVAVDGAGNVYFSDTGNNAVKEYNAATQQVSTLVSSGLSNPDGVAVDAAGNVYIADSFNNAIKEYDAATQQVTTLVSSGLNLPFFVAVGGAGNVYITDGNNQAVKEYSPATGLINTLVSSGLTGPQGVAVDASGNVYITNVGAPSLTELPRAFVSTTPFSEGPNAGSDALLPVLPTSERLTTPFAPTSDQNWLTIDTITSGVINFSFTANSGSARTAHITVLGQSITVIQTGVPIVTSPTATAITPTTATLGGTVTSDGGASLTTVGIVFALTSANPNPTIGGTGVTEIDAAAAALGIFTIDASLLTPGKGYSFAAFATNSIGTAYSPVATFTTVLPADLAGTFRSGTWFLDQANITYSAATTRTFNFGNSTDIPVTGDWDGDGFKDVGVFRPSTGQWLLDVGNKDFSNNPVTGISFGGPGDVPVVGHWLGGLTDYIGVWRPSTGTFYLSLNNQNWDGSTVSDSTILVFQLGSAKAGDMPVVGAWTGGGVDHVGIYRPGMGSQWFLDLNNTSYISNGSPNLIYISNYGYFGDIPVVGKWLADGVDRPGVFRPVDLNSIFPPVQGRWYLNRNDQAWNPNNLAADNILQWGASGDTPVVGDWNGDGISDVGVFRPVDPNFGGKASWYLDQGDVAWNNAVPPTIAPFQFGDSSDRPASGAWQLAGQPQLLDGIPLAGGADSLSAAQLQMVAAEALGNWQAAGLNASQLALLQGAQFEVTSLPSGWLGESLGNVVLIDAKADGHGWSIGGPMAGQVDLLTVVEHEMGHLLGLSDVSAGSANLMSETLAPGMRRAVDGNVSFADPISGTPSIITPPPVSVAALSSPDSEATVRGADTPSINWSSLDHYFAVSPQADDAVPDGIVDGQVATSTWHDDAGGQIQEERDDFFAGPQYA